jgi:hypothetical protein
MFSANMLVFKPWSNVYPCTSAVLESDYLEPNSSSCLHFYYYMASAGVATLRVYTQHVGENRTLLWELIGPQATVWKPAVIPLNATGTFQVSLVQI